MSLGRRGLFPHSNSERVNRVALTADPGGHDGGVHSHFADLEFHAPDFFHRQAHAADVLFQTAGGVANGRIRLRQAFQSIQNFTTPIFHLEEVGGFFRIGGAGERSAFGRHLGYIQGDIVQPFHNQGDRSGKFFGGAGQLRRLQRQHRFPDTILARVVIAVLSQGGPKTPQHL